MVDSYSVLEETRNWANGRGCAASRRWPPDGKFPRMKSGMARRRGRSNRNRRSAAAASAGFVAWSAGALAVLFAVTAIGVSVLFFLPTFPAFMLIDWLDANTLERV